MDNYQFLNSTEPAVIEEYYNKYLVDPQSVDESWRNFFAGFDFAIRNYGQKSSFSQISTGEFKVINLINDYRRRWHLFTKTNPVRKRRSYKPTLAIENYGLTQDDLEKVFEAGNEIGIGAAKLKEIVAFLEKT